MPDEREFMVRAVDQARLSRSETGRLSPKVGAVAVRDGKFLASAHRGEDKDQKEHAEYRLLELKLGTEILAGSTIYTTLEPCLSRGPEKTPCARRLIARRVGRVVIGMLDPDPSVHGKGQMELLEHGVEVGNFDSDLTKGLERTKIFRILGSPTQEAQELRRCDPDPR